MLIVGSKCVLVEDKTAECALVFVFGVERLLLEGLFVVVIVKAVLRAVAALRRHETRSVGQGIGVASGLHLL